MNKIEIYIERVDISYLNELRSVGRRTFFESYSSENTEEDMNEYLDKKFDKEQLLDELNNPNFEFYFAKIEKKVVGYLKLNFGQAQTERNDQNGAEIERIYVLQQYQGKRVGQVLYQKALEIAKEKNIHYLWLGVWEKNPRAILFYQKNGLIEYDRHVFVLGRDKQTDIMMKLEL